MKALQIHDRELHLAVISRPYANDEALVKVLRSGICGTDLEIAKGYSGFSGTIGHEFVGIVEDCTADPTLLGKRVVGEINAGCGKCKNCRAGDSRHCPERTVLGIVGRDGAHAEYLTLPAQNLISVPDEVSDSSAVFVEPLAAALAITERVDLSKMNKVAVVGDGKLGLLCTRVIRALYADLSLTVFGKHPEKLGLAAKGGVETVLSHEAANHETRFDAVVEASGSESGFSTAVDIVRPRGTIVLKSTFHGMPTWDASRIVVNEITVTGSRCGRFQPAVDLLSSNQIEVEDLISEEFSLADGIKAFTAARKPGILKVLLKMNGS